MILCYADDIAIFFENEEKLKTTIKCIKNWTKDNDMIINHKKSGILMLKNKFYNDQ